jgi:hypothetical protein
VGDRKGTSVTVEVIVIGLHTECFSGDPGALRSTLCMAVGSPDLGR